MLCWPQGGMIKTNKITNVADLIGGDPEEVTAALKNLIDDDFPVAPCLVPEALR